MRVVLTVLLGLSTSLFAYAVDLTGSNILRVAAGEEMSDGVQVERNYFEDIFSFDLSSPSLLLHTELGLYHPSEFPGEGLEEDRLLAAHLEYSGPVQVRLGTIEATFGRGLALSLYHDRNLETLLLTDPVIPYFDNRPLGGQLIWWGDKSTVTMLGGWNDYYGTLFGFNSEFLLSDQIQIGSSLVYKAGSELDNITENLSQTILEYYADVTLGDFSVGLNQAFQFVSSDDPNDASSDLYHITYLNADYWWQDYTFALEYKYFKYFPGSLGQPEFMNPPITMNEYTTHLISRHRRLVDYTNETGLMFEVRRNWGDSEYFLNGAWASLTDNDINGDHWLLPNMDERYNAYQEYFGGATHYLPGERLLIWNLAMVEEAVHNGEWARKVGVAVEYEQPLTERLHGKLLVEWMKQQDIRLEEGYNDWAVEASLYRSHMGHLTFKLDRSEDDSEETATNLYAIETVFDLYQGRHKLIMFYGDERGGLVCSSGSCRLVKPFSGLKLTLESWF
jgi:hypothetical protein